MLVIMFVIDNTSVNDQQLGK